MKIWKPTRIAGFQHEDGRSAQNEINFASWQTVELAVFSLILTASLKESSQCTNRKIPANERN